MPTIRNINLMEIARRLRCDSEDLPDGIENKLCSINTAYRPATKSDVERYFTEISDRMKAPGAMRSTEDNHTAWENGWRQNLRSLNQDFSEADLRPKYFRNSLYFRYNKSIILPENANLEHDLFKVVRHYLFQKYFRGFDTAYELGCGSCQNVYALAELFPKMKIHALDWTESSRAIAKIINTKVAAEVIDGLFDMLAPPADMSIEPNSIVFTIHALEQLNTSHENLILYLLDKKPSLILNYEPIVELYDESNLYDYLALKYSQARGYLSGYLDALRRLEKERKIKILVQHRPYIGGVYHEASLIVWKPI